MMSQCTSTVLMVRPGCFGFNDETAASNVFQQQQHGDLQPIVLKEFDHAVSQLQNHGLRVLIAEDLPVPLPDSVFPNNWFTTHADGSVIIYPMLSPKRRKEKRNDIFESLLPQAGFQINRIHDLSFFENDHLFLEGTGSMVMDHQHKIIYACRSSRTAEEPLKTVAALLGYEYVLFNASLDDKEIYHTNVMMTIGKDWAVICPDVIEQQSCRQVLDKLSLFYEPVTVSTGQLRQMACNMLMVVNHRNEPLCILSKTAFDALLPHQLRKIEQFALPVICSIPTIEKIGGGSIRCMLAEIFLPAQNL